MTPFVDERGVIAVDVELDLRPEPAFPVGAALTARTASASASASLAFFDSSSFSSPRSVSKRNDSRASFNFSIFSRFSRSSSVSSFSSRDRKNFPKNRTVVVSPRRRPRTRVVGAILGVRNVAFLREQSNPASS